MLRYHKFTIGHAWMSEYGSPDEEEHYKNLIRYSPLHNIPDSVDNYPATLLLTADHDDRVVPLHSFKFIAELQHKLGSRLSNIPLMLRVDTKAGHGAGKPTERIIEECVDIYSFIINSLNLKFNE
ncbi:prolyl endopeptidase-like protein 2 [Sarcoptes scabiei]|nr:prolyl endopeptidase-like protein 2 [Sarcoptes scabiei]